MPDEDAKQAFLTDYRELVMEAKQIVGPERFKDAFSPGRRRSDGGPTSRDRRLVRSPGLTRRKWIPA